MWSTVAASSAMRRDSSAVAPAMASFDTDSLRPGRDGAGNHERRGQHRAFGAKMVLRQPDGVDAEFFGRFDLAEGLIERLCLRHVLAYVKPVNIPKFIKLSPCARSAKITSIQRFSQFY